MDSGGGRARLVGGGETVREQGEPGKSWDGGDQREQSDRQDGGAIRVVCQAGTQAGLPAGPRPGLASHGVPRGK